LAFTSSILVSDPDQLRREADGPFGQPQRPGFRVAGLSRGDLHPRMTDAARVCNLASSPIQAMPGEHRSREQMVRE
jgi:hypothetical protein